MRRWPASREASRPSWSSHDVIRTPPPSRPLGRTAAARQRARRRMARRRDRRSARGVRRPAPAAAAPPPRARWYWRQALPLAARFAAGRVVPALTPPRRPPADRSPTSSARQSLGAGWSRELRHAWRALWQRPGAHRESSSARWRWRSPPTPWSSTSPTRSTCGRFRFADVDRLILVASDTRRRQALLRPRVGGRPPTSATGRAVDHHRDRAGGGRVVGSEPVGRRAARSRCTAST